MDLLTQLRDIKEPTPISWWPLAPGWYVVCALLLAVVALVFFLLWRHRRKTLTKRKLLQLLCAMKENGGTEQNIFVELSSLLKRAALYVYRRHRVAGLYGLAWLQFLDETLDDSTLTFVNQGKILISAPYQPVVQEDKQEIILLIETWIKKNL